MGQLCDRSVCLCGRERFIALITDPTTQRDSENPASRPAATSESKDGQRILTTPERRLKNMDGCVTWSQKINITPKKSDTVTKVIQMFSGCGSLGRIVLYRSALPTRIS